MHWLSTVQVCDLQPQKMCKQVYRLVPKLSPQEICEDIPREVCALLSSVSKTIVISCRCATQL